MQIKKQLKPDFQISTLVFENHLKNEYKKQNFVWIFSCSKSSWDINKIILVYRTYVFKSISFSRKAENANAKAKSQKLAYAKVEDHYSAAKKRDSSQRKNQV